MPERLQICVLGAGVIGLHAADRLQRDFPQAQVTVLAAGFQEDTTSIGAAGIFRPGAFRAATAEITNQIIKDSWEYYSRLLNSEEARDAGVIELPGFLLTRGPPERVINVQLQRLCPDFRTINDRELNIFPGGWKHGTFCTTMLTDNTYHLPWLTRRVKAAGCEVKHQNVRSLDEIQGFDIIVNCTGLGAKQLMGDTKLAAVRGQVFKVEAPWIKTFVYGGDDTYVIPGVDHVTLGGIRQFENYSTEVNEHDSNGIWARCNKLVPSLKRAKVVREWVGLRPFRDPVRLEKQRLGSGTTVVHSYGHGGYGVMTAPGTAMQVSQMVAEVLQGNFTNPTVSNL